MTFARFLFQHRKKPPNGLCISRRRGAPYKKAVKCQRSYVPKAVGCTPMLAGHTAYGFRKGKSYSIELCVIPGSMGATRVILSDRSHATHNSKSAVQTSFGSIATGWNTCNR